MTRSCSRFARKIKCPVLIGCGLRDDLAPPSSVLAAANVIASPKEVIILPKAGHQDELGTQAAYNERCYGAWLPALREGKPPPIAPLTSSSLAGMTAEQDRQRMMELLNIKQLRRGPDGNPSSPNAANSDVLALPLADHRLQP